MNAPAPDEAVAAPRVMWLLNHGTLREFEMRQLESLGIREVFLPKRFPYDEGNLSASVDRSRDASLSLAADELAVLNAQDWYAQPSGEAWDIANRHFDILFFAFFPKQIESVSRHFRGDAILRVFGHAREHTYSDLLYQYIGIPGVERLQRMGDRFWFGQAYEHLHEIEHDFVRRRTCYLPLGLRRATVEDGWRGDDARLFFVCPRIGSSGHFRSVYEKFCEDFDGVPFAIGGAQPVQVEDDRVLGYVPAEVHRDNMRRFRVMYYHSDEPNHVHYHPFEAVRAGMPLVFMGGGMLDRLGGRRLPGRCTSVREARRKVERLLAGDQRLAEAIRETQPCLLEPMRPEVCEPVWRRNFGALLRTRATRTSAPAVVGRKQKIAVVVPSIDRPVSLLHGRRIARAVRRGIEQAGAQAQVVLAVAAPFESEARLRALAIEDGVASRTFRWQKVVEEHAGIAALFAGHKVRFASREFIVPDDGINQLLDCEALIVTSDDLSYPLLPLRPYALASFGYPQRFAPTVPQGADSHQLQAAAKAAQVWTPTSAAGDQVAHYAGVPPDRIRVLPLPSFRTEWPHAPFAQRSAAFALILEGVPEHRQLEAVDALRAYYETLGGELAASIVVPAASPGERPGSTLPEKVQDALGASSRRIRARARFCSADTFAERAELFAHVRFAVYPSLCDDHGMYAHDALACGLPLIVAAGGGWSPFASLHAGRLRQVDFEQAADVAREMRFVESDRGDRSLPNDVDASAVFASYWEAARSLA